jgi:YbgC/YbaW family acyl-CoA thioester hydrolase
MINRIFKYELTVNFEDVDLGGVVFHPNYLKYLERARSQIMRDAGFPFAAFMKEGFGLVVAENHALYLKPAFLEDRLQIYSVVPAIHRKAIKIVQAVSKTKLSESELGALDGQVSKIPGLIHLAQIKLVCIDLKAKGPTEFPPAFKQALKLPEDFDELPTEQKDVRIQLA